MILLRLNYRGDKMIKIDDLTESTPFGTIEYLFDVTVRIGNMRFRTLCYLQYDTEEANESNPRLYLRFTENKSSFELENIVKITKSNLHLYKKYSVNQLI